VGIEPPRLLIRMTQHDRLAWEPSLGLLSVVNCQKTPLRGECGAQTTDGTADEQADIDLVHGSPSLDLLIGWDPVVLKTSIAVGNWNHGRWRAE